MGQTWTGTTCTGTATTYTWDQAVALTASFAGKSDWRMPSIAELGSIVERDVYAPAINGAIFPNTPASDFWSASANAVSSGYAWVVNFSNGYATNSDKSGIYQVRLVRAGQSFDPFAQYTPSADFTDNSDGTVTHRKTGLTWKRCAEGQTWTGTSCMGTASGYTWDQATKLTVTFAGKSDWRLPTANELPSIVEYQAYNPAINTTIFPNAPASYFWSASAYAAYSGTAWYVYFYFGYAYSDDKRVSYQVRLVRSGQSVGTFALAVATSGTGSGTISSDPSGINCGSTCSANYNSGTTIVLAATPDAGSSFSGWSGACSGTGTCTVTMSAAQSVAATFSLTRALSALPQYNGHRYQRIDGNFSWNDARQMCESRGAHLATITSSEENSFVLNYVVNRNKAYAGWLGGMDDGTEGLWRWITGEPWSYTDWSQSNPDNFNGSENWLGYWVNDIRAIGGNWNDFDTNIQEEYQDAICEWDSASPTVPTALSATVISSLQVNLTWTASQDYAGVAAYKVYRDGTLIASLGNVTAYGDLGLTASTAYSYTVSACDMAENCSAQSAPAAATTPSAAANLVSLAISCPASLASGGSATCSATATYSSGSSKAVSPTWSSNSTAATVASGGTVTANTVMADTQVSITATYTEGGVTRTGTYNLTVKALAPTLTSISIAGGSGTLASGASATLAATAFYSDGTSKAVTLTWTSSNTAAATVSASGQVTAGTVFSNAPVTITATYTEGAATKSATLNMTVLASTASQLSSLSISSGATTLEAGGSTTLRVVASYTDGTSKAVSPGWSSSSPSVITVGTAGTITAGTVAADTAVTLVATYTENGITRTSAITITVLKQSVTLLLLRINAPAAITAGQSVTLTATAFYSDSSSKTVTPNWTSSNSSVAGISSSGVVTAVAVANDTQVIFTAIYNEGSVSKTTFATVAVKSGPVVSAKPSLAAGYLHALGLRNDGSVWAWGWSVLGQSGSGDTKTRSAPAAVTGALGIVQITTGLAHNLAVKADGSVLAWGHNGQGGLGDGTTNDRYTPIAVSGLTDVQSVAAGIFHSLAAKKDGTVWAWGDNSSGQSGDGSAAPFHLNPVLVPGIANVVQVAANLNMSLAVKSDGNVWGWGDLPGRGKIFNPSQIEGLSGVKGLAAGLQHVLALKNDGTVWAWGDNTYGQLGDGSKTARNAPVQVVGLSNVQSIAAGADHSAAVRNDGSLWTWGANGVGQLGLTRSDVQTTPVQVAGFSGASSVAVGSDSTLVLRTDGTVWAAGNNWLGQLGDGSFIGANRFALVQDASNARPFDLATDQQPKQITADQQPKFYMQSDKSGDEAFNALGQLASISLAANIPRNGNGFASIYQMFIAVIVPGGRPSLTPSGQRGTPVATETIFLKNATGLWQSFDGTNLAPYLANVDGARTTAIALDVLQQTDLTGMSGAQFLVGYGTSADEMLSAQRYRAMYQVP